MNYSTEISNFTAFVPQNVWLVQVGDSRPHFFCVDSEEIQAFPDL